MKFYPARYNTYLEAQSVCNEGNRTHPVMKYTVVQVNDDGSEIVRVPDPPKLGKPDMVNAPPHYTRLDPQPLEVIAAWDMRFPLGSAIKYLARAGFKDGADAIQDLEKAVSFIKWEIRQLEKKRAQHSNH